MIIKNLVNLISYKNNHKTRFILSLSSPIVQLAMLHGAKGAGEPKSNGILLAQFVEWFDIP